MEKEMKSIELEKRIENYKKNLANAISMFIDERYETASNFKELFKKILENVDIDIKELIELLEYNYSLIEAFNIFDKEDFIKNF